MKIKLNSQRIKKLVSDVEKHSLLTDISAAALKRGLIFLKIDIISKKNTFGGFNDSEGNFVPLISTDKSLLNLCESFNACKRIGIEKEMDYFLTAEEMISIDKAAIYSKKLYDLLSKELKNNDISYLREAVIGGLKL